MSSRANFFRDEQPIKEKIHESFQEIGKKPQKISLIFWFFWIQVCIAIVLLLTCILVPFMFLG